MASRITQNLNNTRVGEYDVGLRYRNQSPPSRPKALRYGLLTMFQYKSLHDIVLLKASYLKLNLQGVIFAIHA